LAYEHKRYTDKRRYDERHWTYECDRQTDWHIAVNTMYLNENKYTEKRVARSHNVLRLKCEFVDRYVGLHVRSL